MASVYRVLRGDDWARALREYLPPTADDLVRWMEQSTRLLKSDVYSRVGLIDIHGQVNFLKLYVAKSPLQKLAFRLGVARGVRSFDAAVLLQSMGINVPAPRACVQTAGGILLLTAAVGAGHNLRGLWSMRPAAELCAEYMHDSGELLSSFHRRNFAHGDCKWSNLVRDESRFYLVDLEDVRKVSGYEERQPQLHWRQLRDIARFTADAESMRVTATEYGVFLDSYCRGMKLHEKQLLQCARPHLEEIRQRHQSKYGIRHPQLF